MSLPLVTLGLMAPVIGGTPTPQGEFPAVGALVIDGALHCTGTLIRPDVVLTAAHCVQDGVPGFTLDNDIVAATPTVVAGDHYWFHEGYDTIQASQGGLGHFDDVGLVFLAEPITDVAPMEMATPEEAAAGFVDLLAVQIVGYGATSSAGSDYGVKYDAEANLYTWNDYEMQIGNGLGTPQNCYGDSGGPAIADWGDGPRVVGIVSRGFTLDFECAYGGVDTRADVYRDWVRGQLHELPDAGVGADAGTAAEGGDAGCCSSASGGAGGGLLLALGALAVLSRPRRRTPRRCRRSSSPAPR